MRVTRTPEARMRGDHEQQAPMWSYISPEQRIPQDHPLRPLRALVDAVLKELSPRFSRLYAKTGRPSVAPERLLRALLLQVLYSIRSERQNRQRLLDGDVAEAFFDAVLAQARDRHLLSHEHFTVDGTLIQAWAGLKSFQRKDQPPAPPDDPGNPTVNCHGERRSNATHQSTTDPDARLFRKGGAQEARLYYQGHVLMDHRHGLAVGGQLTAAGASAERDAAVVLAAGAIGRARATLAADKAYDTRDFVATLRALGVTPHLAQNTTKRRSAIDARTTRHPGYALSQRARKRVEEIFGWLKTVALLRQTRHRGRSRVGWMFLFGLAAYNLIRIRNLSGAPA
jgi:transposase